VAPSGVGGASESSVDGTPESADRPYGRTTSKTPLRAHYERIRLQASTSAGRSGCDHRQPVGRVATIGSYPTARQPFQSTFSPRIVRECYAHPDLPGMDRDHACDV